MTGPSAPSMHAGRRNDGSSPSLTSGQRIVMPPFSTQQHTPSSSPTQKTGSSSFGSLDEDGESLESCWAVRKAWM